MVEIRKTDVYAKWLDGLLDVRGQPRILARVERLATANPREVELVGGGVSELRIDYGPGYRVYYK
jgi:putative addiction module killer protein